MHELLTQKVIRQSALMGQMMERLGVDSIVAQGVDGGLAWREAHTKCLFCSNGGACRNWLEDSYSLLPGPKQFCPNMAFFRGCFSTC
jgi:hypothetical protein